MSTFRSLPDPNSSLYESRDFIFESALARRALESDFPQLAPFVADLLDATHRLVQSCHLPEFTDHGLPHLCSLVDRISRWELPDDAGILPNSLTPDLARTLLIATLIHDLGMLSQKPEDLSPKDLAKFDLSQWSNTAAWVRSTHVHRLPMLLRRVMCGFSDSYEDFFDRSQPNNIANAIDVAQAHQRWPWEWSGVWQKVPENRGLAAVVSVADLLDEDAARCDTETLLQHREGDELNRAHWIRHILTGNRVMVEKGTIRVELLCPPGVSSEFKPVFSALRNHFRLVSLYEDDLNHINASVTNVHLEPSTGIPQQDVASLVEWSKLDGYANKSAFALQLLRTFMNEALKDSRKYGDETAAKLQIASLEDVDLSLLKHAQGEEEPRTKEEQTFEAIVGPFS